MLCSCVYIHLLWGYAANIEIFLSTNAWSNRINYTHKHTFVIQKKVPPYSKILLPIKYSRSLQKNGNCNEISALVSADPQNNLCNCYGTKQKSGTRFILMEQKWRQQYKTLTFLTHRAISDPLSLHPSNVSAWISISSHTGRNASSQ
jgi:hypothetical protein